MKTEKNKSVLLLSEAGGLKTKVKCQNCQWNGVVDDCQMRFCILLCPKCLSPVKKHKGRNGV